MPAAINIIGRQFGKLKVLEDSENLFDPNGRPYRASLCECACGKRVVVRNNKLTSGHSQSCGCQRAESNKKHGYGTRDRSDSGIYSYWKNLKRKANVCIQWQKSFEQFLADAGPRPDGHGLTVIDRSKPFEPGNVEWRPSGTIRPVRMDEITVQGVTGSLTALCEHFKVVSLTCVMQRIADGMPADLALTKPRTAPEDRQVKHGGARRSGHTREYRIWRAMVRRCTDQNLPAYVNYGARGITVCEAWLDFPKFFADMGECPAGKSSIERKDNEQGYFKDNCVWADAFEQANNKRTTVKYTVRGFTGSLAQLCRHFVRPYHRTLTRLHRGFEIEQALFSEHGTSVSEAVEPPR